MAWDDGLSGKALDIAKSKAKRLRVIAGPGTGKSFAMKRRIARLLEQGVSPGNILAVTFTRTAAAALVKDLMDLGVSGCESVRVGTLHSLCFSILKRDEVFDYLQRKPNPIISFNSYGVLQYQAGPLLQDLDAPSKFGNKRDKTKRIRAFEAAWARLQSEAAGWPRSATDKAFELELTNWLRFHDAMLIGELVLLTLRYLRSNPSSPILSQFKHVIVDEYQDLNKAEQELIDLIGGKSSIAAVGDPDQSIYSFRHANPQGIKKFGDSLPDLDAKDLDECRRCPTLVVKMANDLILNNYAGGSAARLHPLNGNPQGEVNIVQWNDLNEQTSGTADFVKHLIDKKGYLPGDVLILSPRRQIGYDTRDALVKKGIPCHSFFSEESLEEDEAQLAFTLLLLLVDNEDRVALRFWLGFGSQSWLENQYSTLREHCEITGDSPWKALVKVSKGKTDIHRIANVKKRFEELLGELEKIRGRSGEELVNKLFPKKKTWASALREAALADSASDMTPAAILERLRRMITQPEVPESSDFVRIMSLHKAKGLTAKVTIVLGAIQGLIPLLLEDGTPAEKEEVVKEHRRVFYVAITRATDILCVSSFRMLEKNLAYRMRVPTRSSSGAYGKVITSQFVNELGPHAPKVQQGVEWRRNKFC